MNPKKKVHPLLRVIAIIAWVILAVVIFQSCTAEDEPEMGGYDITTEELNGVGAYYADIITEASEEDELKTMLDELMEDNKSSQNEEISSAMIRIYNAEELIAIAKIAYDGKGRAQTGIEQQNEWNIEMQ